MEAPQMIKMLSIKLTIFIYLLISISCFGQSNTNKPIFIPTEKISLQEGLPNHHIRSIIQDKSGFIWIGSINGLFKHDGVNFEWINTFNSNRKNLQNSVVNTLFEDNNGDIWIGTSGGLDKLDTKFDTIIHFKQISKPNFKHLHVDSCINTGEVRDIKQDTLGRLWIALYGGGVNCYNPKTKLFTHYINKTSGTLAHQSNLINGLFLDKDGTLWIATESTGIFKMNIYSENQLTHINTVENGIYSSILRDSKQQLWAGSWINGLIEINPNTFGNITNLYDNTNSRNTIRTLVEDKNNKLWIATFRDGLFQFNSTLKKWTPIIYDTNGKNDIAKNITTWTIFEDKSGLIWIGTWGDGIYKLSPNSNDFQTIYLSDDYKSTNILSFLKIDAQTILIGTETQGLLKFNTNNKSILKIETKGKAIKNIRTLVKDIEGTIWIGGDDGVFTLNNNTIVPISSYINLANVYCIEHLNKNRLLIGTHGDGLFLIDKKKGLLHNYKQESNNDNSLSADIIWDIHFDGDSSIWIATPNGLDKINLGTDKITHFLQSKSISNIYTHPILGNENLWIGTFNLGLIKINTNTNKTTSYPINLPNELPAIYSLNYINNNLWIGTNGSFLKFNTTTEEFEVIQKRNSLLEEGYNLNSSISNNNQEIISGGKNGFTIFNPSNFKTREYKPNIFLSELLLFNKKVEINEQFGNRVILDTAISQKNHLILNYNNYMFTIDFGCDDYLNTQNITYAYMLEGFDANWTYAPYNRRFLTYTNLKPGIYQLKIKSTNSDGIWCNNEKIVTIEILPPFWKTWWAYILYLVVGALLLVIFKTIIQKREKLKNDLIFKIKSAEQKEEGERLKLNFFTNLSHEFRTPLTLILGTLDLLSKESLNSKIENQLDVINRNSRRLLYLINQILDLSKIDSAKMVIEPSEADIVEFTSTLINNFKNEALRKKIIILFNSNIPTFQAIIDFNKYENILTNIISNSIKYTNNNGEIAISLELHNTAKASQSETFEIEIKVIDNGIGISEDKLPHIFNRFYQVEHGNGGTGIGLAYTKELIELLNGRIWVKSQVGVGSQFNISLPLAARSSNFESNKLQSNKLDINNKLHPNDEFSVINGKTITYEATILIAEDNYDMRKYIISSLQSTFKIIEAENGKTAWFEIINQMPDIVISDIMMPERNGIELCKMIKSNEQTSHIPVILLTAMATEEYKIKGLTDGADIYISKPFNAHILNAQVISLLNNRNILKDRFLKKLSMDSDEFTNNKLDQEFFFRISNIIENNLNDHNLNIDFICHEMSISKTHLYTKIKAITGQSASEFIKIVRLKYAAILIKDGHKVSKVYSQVGFKTQPHFTRAFKEHFGISPSDYCRTQIN